MKVKDLIKQLLDYNMDEEITTAHNSMRPEIRSSDIKEEDGRVIIEC